MGALFEYGENKTHIFHTFIPNDVHNWKKFNSTINLNQLNVSEFRLSCHTEYKSKFKIIWSIS